MKFVDLFAGIGGFHQAANSAFGKDALCVATCENDPKCKQFLLSHYKLREESYVDDIRSLYNNDSQISKELPKHDILFGGFPCQPFSNVGLRKGLNDSRGTLFYDLARVIDYSTPKLFLLENVQKIITLQKGNTLKAIVSHLEAIGYSVSIWDLRSDEYGLPQKRRRIFLAGIRSKNKLSPIPPPDKVKLEDSQYSTVWDLLDRSMPERHIVPYGSRKTIFQKNSKWMGHIGINNIIARPLCASMGKWHRANQDNYFTEDYVYENKRPNLIEYDWTKENLRRISPVESLRLQGFPTEMNETFLEQKISITSQYKMLGNAVPVNLATKALNQLMKYA